jgi:protein TonB
MTRTDTGWRLLALSISILLHIALFMEWSDTMIAKASIEQQEKPPLLVQLSFQKPPPKTKPVIKQELAQQPQKVSKPKPKIKPKKKPKLKKKIKKKPDPKPETAIAKPILIPDTKPVISQPPPAQVQPKVDQREQYLAKLLAMIEENKHYPAIARRRNLEGKIEVKFNLSCDGVVSDLSTIGPHSLLRKAARKAINAAQPLPAPPAHVKCPLPIHYAMAYVLEKNN